MAAIWVLSADGGRAKILTADTAIGGLTELETFVDPGVRVRQMELKTDRPGQTASSAGGRPRAMAVEVEPKKQERIRFAKMIAERLERARVANAFERLVLVGAPAFLGLLRESMGAALRSQVSLEVNKDYVTLRPRELRSRLARVFLLARDGLQPTREWVERTRRIYADALASASSHASAPEYRRLSTKRFAISMAGWPRPAERAFTVARPGRSRACAAAAAPQLEPGPEPSTSTRGSFAAIRRAASASSCR
jgi:protein required for attachment to host cells